MWFNWLVNLDLSSVTNDHFYTECGTLCIQKLIKNSCIFYIEMVWVLMFYDLFLSESVWQTVKLKQRILQFQLSVSLSHKTSRIPTIQHIKASHICDVSLQKGMHTLTKGNIIFYSNTWSTFPHFPARLSSFHSELVSGSPNRSRTPVAPPSLIHIQQGGQGHEKWAERGHPSKLGMLPSAFLSASVSSPVSESLAPAGTSLNSYFRKVMLLNNLLLVEL